MLCQDGRVQHRRRAMPLSTQRDSEWKYWLRSVRYLQIDFSDEKTVYTHRRVELAQDLHEGLRSSFDEVQMLRKVASSLF